MTNKKTLLEKRIREIHNQILKETENTTKLDTQEVKAVLDFVNLLAKGSNIEYKTNNQTIISLYKKIRNLRIELMDYVEANSNYEFLGKSPSGWKLINKKK